MNAPSELFRRFLRDELQGLGINPDEIVALRLKERSPSRRRARLVRVEKIQPEPILRKIGEPSAIFHVTSVPISQTKYLLVWRQNDQISMLEIKVGTAWRRPKPRRFIAQKLPSVRVRKASVERIIVSTPARTSVLNLTSRQPSIALTSEMLNPVPILRIRIGRWETVVEGTDWKTRLRSWRAKYPLIQRRWDQIEVASALVPEPKWVRLTDLM